MTRLKSALAMCCVLTLSALAPNVSAQTTPDAKASEASKAEASAHFQRGAELFQDGLFRSALVELKRAYEIAPNPRVLYNIAQTHVALGEFVEAVHAYEDYLSLGGASVPAARRAELEAELPQLRSHVATLTIRINRDGASVTVDDKEVGTSPLPRGVSVDVGRHRVTARGEDGATATTEIDVAGGDQKEVSLVLVATRASAQPTPASAPVTEPAPKFSVRQKWAIGLLSSAGALALTGGALALVAKSARDDHEKELDNQPGDPSAIAEANDRMFRSALAADIMWGAAVLTGISGAVLLVMKERDPGEKPAAKKKVDVRLGLTPRAVFAEGRF